VVLVLKMRNKLDGCVLCRAFHLYVRGEGSVNISLLAKCYLWYTFVVTFLLVARSKCSYSQ